MVGALDPVRYPIRGTFPGCCASAVTATTSNTTATRIDGTAAFFIAHLVCVFITEMEIKKSVIYGGRKTRFVEGEKTNFYVGLN